MNCKTDLDPQKPNNSAYIITMSIGCALSSIACLSIILSYILFKELRTI